jgi:hypothetical protein
LVTAAAGRGGGWRELSLVVLGYGILTILLISPLALHPGSVARLDNADTRHIIWNVAWVARTLVLDPFHVFDTNIFYPHRGTLAYSESNLGAGILAIPVYWATRNPYAAHNFVGLLSFVLCATCTYYLVRYLVSDRRAAAIAGICFAFSPYALSHLPHVHLLMTAGLPLSMAAFHRVADRPTTWRGAALGAAMAAQAIFCGYYGVFVTLTVGFAVIVVAATRRLWRDLRYWTAIGVAAVVAVVIALPLFLPYMRLQRETGFARAHDARQFSADWRTYFASSAYAHAWMLRIIGRWNEVLFPGFVALVGGVAGFLAGWRGRSTDAVVASAQWRASSGQRSDRRAPIPAAPQRLREVSILYGGLAVLAYWASLGPDAGLYRVLNLTLPAFSFMRAPSRFGLIVSFALSVLAGVAISALLARLARPAPNEPAADARTFWHLSRPAFVSLLIALVAVLELKAPLSFSQVPPVNPAYRMLAGLPRGPVIELPFYSWRFAAARTEYVLNSTVHWMPLVNGYSSYTPREFMENTPALGGFPSLEAFRILERDRVRYAVFHVDRFSPDAREDLIKRLATFDRYLRRLYADESVWLHEIVEFPR